MVGIYANDQFMRYRSGVFRGCPINSASLVNHAVLLVGYNDQNRYWLLKNQYSESWG